MGQVVIVGAGIAGLTAGLRLAEEGKRVVLIEKEKAVGGLARSFTYGGVSFDIGPHRFFSEKKDVNEFIQKILGDQVRTINRQSAVWLFGKYFNWPLTLKSVTQLPFLIQVMIGLDGLCYPFQKKDARTFEGFVISRFGQLMYRKFFLPYTYKFIGYHPREIHPDWGRVGIDRAVIDKRVRSDNILQMVRQILLEKSEKMRFIYPEEGGIGRFCELMREKIESLGGKVILSSAVDHITEKSEKVVMIKTSNGQKIEDIDSLIWTAPVTQLYRMLFQDEVRLEYLDSIIYNFILDGSPLLPHQWCYYGTEDTIFNRISIPSLFVSAAPNLSQHGCCVEIATRSTSYLWKNPLACINRMIEDLKKTGLITDHRAVMEVFVERIENSYPIYKLNYREEFHKASSRIGAFKNVHLLGRCGAFWYNNMDHSIEMALNLALSLVGLERRRDKEEIF